MEGKEKRIRNILLAVAVIAVLSGTALVTHAVIGGQPDDDNHPYVGLVTDYFTGGTTVCSCVAVSPTIIVTSAHCFDEVEPPIVAVIFDPVIDPINPPPPLYWHFGVFIPHPDFCYGCGPGTPAVDTHDVAVIVLSDPIPPVVLDTYAQLPVEGLNDTLAMGAEVTTVGYGVTQFYRGGGPPAWGFPEGGFTRHFAPVKLIASEHIHQDEFIKLSGSPAKKYGKFCFGDSGGPNLLGDTDIILALTAYGNNHMCVGVGYANRLDTAYALEFIEYFLLLTASE